ncbi:MAG: hypothetical protein WBQ26_01570 [Gemmatimonadaceae bacterium]
MIVDDLDFVRIALGPSKANPPLIVNTDTVLAGSVPVQLLQAIPGSRDRREPTASRAG